MVELRLDEIARRMRGTLLQGEPGRIFRAFNFDSRQTTAGELFFAVVAERDGHDFVSEAWRKGAGGAVVSREVAIPDPSFGLVRVSDTVAALQTLAAETLRLQGLKVVGITGSAGKTTTKEFTATLLGGRFQVLKSSGNYNNHLGLALAVLGLEEKHELAVLEMAMRGPGEIRRLTRVAPPDIAVITNINPVHLAYFRSLEDIGAAKREILEGTRADGKAVLNHDDPLVRQAAADWTGEKIFFGFSPECQVRAERLRPRGYDGLEFILHMDREKAKVRIPFFYDSFVFNLLAACGVAFGLGLTLADLLPRFALLKPFFQRGSLVHLYQDIALLDDSYNSNPRALESALKGTARLPAKRKVAILGDMMELGPRDAEYHQEAGRKAARLGFKMLITVGPLAGLMAEAAIAAGLKQKRVYSFDTAEEAAEAIGPLLRRGDLILVKGSHSVHLEKVVAKIKDVIKET
jgi:UDP-N-acetylmuramoyl-tripeptide--D-alanyl-D-alanine ligase